MNKTILTILMVVAFIVCTTVLSAQTWEIGSPNPPDVVATLSGGVLTIAGTGNMQDWHHNGPPWYSFTITGALISQGVTNIGGLAFFLCTSLTSVTIPNSVTSIGDWAFYGCTGLTSVTIPNSVTNIGEGAFFLCTGLTSVTIPNSVTIIEGYAFYGCIRLTIYAEALNQPAGWHADWNHDGRPVVWGHVSDDDAVIPATTTALSGNYPNPFNPETTIRFSVSVDSVVSIDIYNIRGQKIRTVFDGFKEIGEHSVIWNGTDDHGREVSSGVYFYNMRSGEYVETRRMMLMK